MKKMIPIGEILEMTKENALLEFADFINSTNDSDDVIFEDSIVYNYIKRLADIYLISDNNCINMENVNIMHNLGVDIYIYKDPNKDWLYLVIDTIKGAVII